MKIVCPKCKGNGKVFEPASLLLGPVLPFMMFFDAALDDGDECTKKKCPLCKGKKLLDVS